MHHIYRIYLLIITKLFILMLRKTYNFSYRINPIEMKEDNV